MNRGPFYLFFFSSKVLHDIIVAILSFNFTNDSDMTKLQLEYVLREVSLPGFENTVKLYVAVKLHVAVKHNRSLQNLELAK